MSTLNLISCIYTMLENDSSISESMSLESEYILGEEFDTTTIYLTQENSSIINTEVEIESTISLEQISI